MPVIKGTAHNDTLDGTEDADLIQGLGGDRDTFLEIDPDASFAPFQSETTILFENVSMSALTTHNLGGHAPGGSAVPGISLRGKPAEIVSANEEWIRPDARDVATPARSEFGTVVTGLFAETDPFQVNTVTAGSQGEPVIASLASGGFVVAWMSGQNVKVQVFDRHGDKVGGEFLADASNNGNPAVLGLASGGFVVGWSDFVSGEVGIWARMFDAAGNPLGGSFEVSSGTSTGNPTQPSFAALSSGGFVASWTDQDVPFSSMGITAQIFDTAGAKVGGEFAVNTTTSLDQFFSLTGGLPGGGFVATWVDQLSGFLGQIFDASGSKVGAEFAVGSSNGSYNALTVLSSGNFIVALVDGNGDISGQIFSPAGAPVGGPFKLNTVTDNNHDMPTLTALPDGGFVASWREATGTTTNFFEDGEIKAQVFDANGVKIGDEFMVNVGTSGGQMIPKVVAFGSGDFTIVWVDFQSSQSEIKARTYFSVDLGTNGDDSFVGTADRDFYQGLDGNDQVSGGSEDDSLDGGGGNDVLRGGSGFDQLYGGTGDDIYYIEDQSGDRVFELDGEGRDVVYAAHNYVLAAGQYIEVLSALGHANTTPLELTGNNLAQEIWGNAGANTLRGGGGADSLVGQSGNDTYIVENLGVSVIERADGGARDVVYSSVNYTLGAGQYIEVLSALGHANTTPLVLTGNSFAQEIWGNAGANTLRGGGGNDILVGQSGNDTYIVENLGVSVIERADGGVRDVVYSSVNYTLGAGQYIEVLSALGHANTTPLVLTGNSFAQEIWGNAGANTLDGGGGNDILIGLGGNDIYLVNVAGVKVIETAGNGHDVVYAAVNYTLGAGQSVEVLSARGHAGTAPLVLTGNELAQEIWGNAGNNILDGKGGNDTLVGLGGADTFAFTTAPGAGNIDRIVDFSVVDDTIALDDAVFTGLGLGALGAHAFVIGSAAGDADDRIIYNSATGALYFDADGSGAGAQIQFASIGTGLSLTASDFAVI